MARGRFLRLFIGNMASGKTRHLLTEIDTLRKYGNKKIAVFKPRTDTRSGMNCIKSRKGDEDAAEEISVTAPNEMWPRSARQGIRRPAAGFKSSRLTKSSSSLATRASSNS